MNFKQLTEHPDKEALCHAVFHDAHDLWTKEGRNALNESQLTVLCVEIYFGEVCNGGLEQYLFNESGRIASFGAASLRRVGLPAFAAILDEALGRCANSPETNELGIVEDFIEPPDYEEESILEDLNKRFFQLYFADKEEFRRKLFRYIVDHEGDFVSVD